LIPVELDKRIYYQYLGFLNTPALFNNQFQSLEQFIMPKHNIPTFENFSLSIPDRLPLGKRVEYFFEYFIRQNNEYKLIQNNTQIIQNNVTHGELDYIFEEVQTHKKYHVELIYKYYLYLENQENELKSFMGPNFDDSLEKRVLKLNTKQLPLLFKEETQEYLQDLDIKNISQKVCFRANIFLPYNSNTVELKEINSLCIKGKYLTAVEFLNDKTFQKYSYFFPEKQDWLIDMKHCESWFSYEEIFSQIQTMLEQKRTPLLWQKNGTQYLCLFLIF